MDVDMAAVWPLQVPEGPGTHDQPRPPGAQHGVADGRPAPSGGSPVSEGGWVRDEQVATMIDHKTGGVSDDSDHPTVPDRGPAPMVPPRRRCGRSRIRFVPSWSGRTPRS